MFPRVVRLCHQFVDESFINLRRFSAKHSKASQEYFSDNEKSDNEGQYEEQYEGAYEGQYMTYDESIEKPKRFCIIKCKRSEFDFYMGDTYPKFKVIPLASRGWHHRKSVGDYFTIYPSKLVEREEVDMSVSFQDFGLHNGLISNLEEEKLINPTTIQKLAIPKLLDRENAILTAETGCGKTYAFLVPVLQQILEYKGMQDRGCNRPLALIVTPSRELTRQISRVAKRLAKNLDINIVTFIAGGSKRIINNPPVNEVDLLIGSIGVMKKLFSNKIYKSDQLKHVVLDEADTLFDPSFFEGTVRFLRKLPIGANRDPSVPYPSTAQITLNSATIPENIHEILKPIVNVDSLNLVTTGFEHQIRVPQKFYRLTGAQKPEMLLKLLKPKIKNKVPVIIFSNTFKTCEFTSLFLESMNIKTINLHGKIKIQERLKKFTEFQNGQCMVMTTTDAGARGLDTTMVQNIINFEFPLITAEYIHRCGRTGRIGSPKDCRIYNLISRPLEIVLTSKIEFAARKMKPIPMVDMIHRKEEDKYFLGPDAAVPKYKQDISESPRDKDNSDDDDDDDNDGDDDEELYTVPQ